MNIRQIKKAIKMLEVRKLTDVRLKEKKNPTSDYDRFLDDNFKANDIAIQALQCELKRQKNKPLTIKQLKNMVGEPVWVKCEKPHWIIIEKIHFTEDYFNVLAQNNTWYTDIEMKFDVFCQFEGVDNCNFYKHKPQEVGVRGWVIGA